MIKNYFKTACRKLKKDKIYTIINVMGLVIGICASWIIFSVVDYEFSYDNTLPDGDRVYQLVYETETPNGDLKLAGTSNALQSMLENEIPGVELIVPLIQSGYYHGQADRPDAEPLYDPTFQIQTNASYFQLVSYEWLSGDPQTALNAPGHVVLTASRAKAYFPNLTLSEIQGKTILYNDSLAFQVAGIVADLTLPNSFVWQEIFPLMRTDLEEINWNQVRLTHQLMVKLRNNVKPTHITDPINEALTAHRASPSGSPAFAAAYRALPLKEFHFAQDIQGMPHRTVNKSILYGLIGIAAFLMLLACINYVNLTTARIPAQSKNIGIRKALGIKRGQLIGGFVVETLLVTVLAVILAVGISFLLEDPLRQFLPEGIYLLDRIGFKIVFLAILIITVTVLSSLYPAWMTMRVRTIDSLRHKVGLTPGQSGIHLRKGLIVFQFVIGIVFTICAVIIGMQLRYTTHKDLGFDHRAMVSIDLPIMLNVAQEHYGKMFQFKQELEKHAAIESVTLGDLPMDTYMPMVTFHPDGLEEPATHLAGMKFIGEDYLEFYGMELLAGKNIVNSDTANAYVITESFSKILGYASPEEALGQQLWNDHQKVTLPIAGVIADFHQQDLRTAISPAVMVPTNFRLHVAHVRFASASPKDWTAAISLIENEWNALYPTIPFEYEFYDEQIEAMYSQEQLVGKLVGLGTATTILISCLGLFGLATLTAFQRTKEIGIRKVLGASITNIVSLLSKDFILLVLLATVIASPIAWWAMNRWLEDFVYRIEIQWWMFAIAGLSAVVIALLTVSWQAVRAAIANPVDSLRDE